MSTWDRSMGILGMTQLPNVSVSRDRRDRSLQPTPSPLGLSFYAHRITMVRTKQTAKKSTGGEAPRVSLLDIPRCEAAAAAALQQQVNKTKPLDALPVPTVSDRSCLTAMFTMPSGRDEHVNDDFCHMCADGGLLYNCDSCPRAVCRQCLSVPIQHATLVLEPDVKFLCVSCHWKDDVRSGGVSPYLGFYRDGLPVLPDFLAVTGDFQLPIRSEISSRRMIIVHIRVHTIPLGGPVLMLEQFLRPYFAQSGKLVVKNVAFNLTTSASRKQYEQEAAAIVAEIGDTRGSNVLFSLVAHSDDDRGDLMVGLSCQKKHEIASTVTEVLDILLGPFERIASGSMFVMFACGAIVNKAPSFDELCKAITRFRFASAIAFDAVRLQPSTCWPFIVFLAEAVFIEGHDLEVAVPCALGHSHRLGQHSGVYVLTRVADSLAVTKYFWSHRDFHPWGFILPVQCQVCGTPQQWQRKVGNDFSYVFECRYQRCGWDATSGKVVRPRGQIEVRKPDGVKIHLQGKTRYSGWLSLEVVSP
ncbi:hypothetical protein HD554DRAFT_2267701 [Boletus coccyginus]|nr:hypothetical protein HD554DRAFT_2267701 [Boletus coccyginus]